MDEFMVSTEDSYQRFRWGWLARRTFNRLRLRPGEAAVLAKFPGTGVMVLLDTRHGELGEGETYGRCKLPLDVEVDRIEAPNG